MKTYNIGVSWESTFHKVEAETIEEAKLKLYDMMTQEEKDTYCDMYEVNE
jgi:hypothetical protein